tara:strand:+ start:3460 stop:4044 length:585 start_codon:yes stop_codon:yes gene_type:complete
MIITNFLSDIFSGKKIQIMRFFSDYSNGQFTGREVAKQLTLNNKTCHIILNELCEIGLLKKSIVGKAHLFNYCSSYYWDEIINDMLKKEKNIMNEITKDMVYILKDDVDKIILFGSYAAKNETSESDVDVCLVTKKRKEALEQKKEQLETVFYDKYLCHLSIYILGEKEFKDDAFPIIKEIKEEGIELWSKQNQ